MRLDLYGFNPYSRDMNAMQNTKPETMTADLCDDTWTVVDSEGGRWWPSDEAADEIAASNEPAATAVRIATNEPMRGQWRS